MIVIFSYIFKLIYLFAIVYVIYLICKVAKIIQSDLKDDEKVKALKKLLIRKDKR